MASAPEVPEDARKYIDRQWVASGEASRMVGVATKTVRTWAKAGKIRGYFTPGGKLRYDRADLESLIKNCSAGAYATR